MRSDALAVRFGSCVCVGGGQVLGKHMAKCLHEVYRAGLPTASETQLFTDDWAGQPRCPLDSKAPRSIEGGSSFRLKSQCRCDTGLRVHVWCLASSLCIFASPLASRPWAWV